MPCLSLSVTKRQCMLASALKAGADCFVLFVCLLCFVCLFVVAWVFGVFLGGGGGQLIHMVISRPEPQVKSEKNKTQTDKTNKPKEHPHPH